MSNDVNIGAGVKYFVGGMVVLLIIVKPGVLTGIANGISEQPVQPQVVQNEDNFRQFDHILSRFEELALRLSERPSEIEERRLPPQNQTSHTPEKVAAFEAALEAQRQKELEVQYNGNDPIVRQRVGLGPKLTTIEEFDYPGEEIVTIEKFDKVFNQQYKLQ